MDIKRFFIRASIASIISLLTVQNTFAQDVSGGITVGGPFKLTAEQVQQIREETGLLEDKYNTLFADKLCDTLMSHAPGAAGHAAVGLGSLLGLCPSMEEMLGDGIEEINDQLEDMCYALESLKEGRKCEFTPNDIEPTCGALGDFCKEGLKPYMGITVNKEGDAYCWGRFSIPGCECNDDPPGRRKYYPVPSLQEIIEDLLWEVLPHPAPPVRQVNSVQRVDTATGQGL